MLSDPVFGEVFIFLASEARIARLLKMLRACTTHIRLLSILRHARKLVRHVP